MAGDMLRGLQAAACVCGVGVVLGLATFEWLPHHMKFWGGDLPRIIGMMLIPLVGVAMSLLLALVSSCDPLMVSQSSSSRAAVAAVVALPSFLALPLHIIILWASLSNHVIGITPLTVLTGVLLICLAVVFNYVEQNYVVGIRDLWTLRSAEVWEKTHSFASKLFALVGVAGIVLAWFVPQGMWQLLLIAGLLLLPTGISVIYSYLIREDTQYQYIIR